MEDNEIEAMNNILQAGPSEETTTQGNQEESVQETTQEENQDVSQNSQNEDNQSSEVDINSLDLSHLGINSSNEDNNENNINEQSQANNEMETILQKLDNIQKSKEQEEDNINEQELQPLRDLAQKLQSAGLIEGLSSEDRKLLNDVKEFKERQEEQARESQEQMEYENKINSLDSFSKSLESSVPGYDTELMKKVVSDIIKEHPQARDTFLNNPTQLLLLWQQVGQKAQPKNIQENIINSNTSTNVNSNLLDEKIKNGTASEEEEAKWLFQSFQ